MFTPCSATLPEHRGTRGASQRGCARRAQGAHWLPLAVTGLSAPVPRGRKGKKTKNQMLLPEIKNADWLATCNPEVVLHDDSYKKHLKQHCNK